MNESSCCSTSSALFGIVSVSDYGHSNVIQWYITVVLICNSLMTYDVEHLFICYLLSLYLFGEVSVQNFCLFLNWIVHFLIVEFQAFYVYFGNSPLSDMSFANIFSQSVTCLPLLLMCCFFTLLVASFDKQTFLIFIWSNLSKNFPFWSVLITFYLRNVYLSQSHKNVLYFILKALVFYISHLDL